LQESHTKDHCGAAKYFGTTGLFRRSEFEGYGDSFKILFIKSLLGIKIFSTLLFCQNLQGRDLQKRHTRENYGVAYQYFGTVDLFKRSEFEGYGDSLKTLHSKKFKFYCLF
jgi:hypothetical protein